MIDTVISVIANSILTLSGIIFFVFVVSSFLPHLTFKFKYKSKKLSGRGIKKIIFNDGKCIVYEPSHSIRDAVNQYSLIKKNNSKYIKCKLGDGINFIQYEIVVFNSKNKIIDLISVNEKISERGYTQAVELPQDTSYVEFVLRKVNNVKRSDCEFPVTYAPGLLAVYLLAVVLCTFVEAQFLQYTLSNIFNELNISGANYPDFTRDAAFFGVICGVAIILYYTVKLKKGDRR